MQADVHTDPVAYLVFRLEERQYALPISAVVEVAAMLTLDPLPGAPPTLLGVANRHGEPLPILDLRRVLGLSPCVIRAETLFIVLAQAEHCIGLVVDEVDQVQYIARGRLRAAPADTPYVAQLATTAVGLVQILAVEPLFTLLTPTPKQAKPAANQE